MSKIDKIKEEIGWLKVLFTLLIAINVSLIGWLVQNFENANNILLIVALTIIVIVTLAIALTNRKAYKKIDELGDL